jgi:hypothetical protein
VAPLKDKLAQFIRDKPKSGVLAQFSHPFGYVVKIFDGEVVLYEKSGRVADANELLDVFIAEARAAVIQFGAERLACFAPTKA